MTALQGADGPPADRVDDVVGALSAMNEAVREALLRHKKAGRPIAVWRHDRVEWIEPADILPDSGPADEPER